jgi:thymidine phosphorylase
VAALGGPHDLIDKPANHLAAAPVARSVLAHEEGVVEAIDTRALGLAVVALGGGRTRAQDPIDHAVGLTGLPAVGDTVPRGEPLAMVHARSEAQAEQAAAAVRAACRIGPGPVQASPMIARRIEGVA